jgi:hypothetical protein
LPKREVHDWAALRARYVMGEETQRDMAAATGVSERQINEHSAAELWPEQREGFRAAVAAKALSLAREKQAKELVDVADRVRIIGRSAMNRFAEQLNAKQATVDVRGFVAVAELLLRIDHRLPSIGDYRPAESDLENVDVWLEGLTGGPVAGGVAA